MKREYKVYIVVSVSTIVLYILYICLIEIIRWFKAPEIKKETQLDVFLKGIKYYHKMSKETKKTFREIVVEKSLSGYFKKKEILMTEEYLEKLNKQQVNLYYYEDWGNWNPDIGRK